MFKTLLLRLLLLDNNQHWHNKLVSLVQTINKINQQEGVYSDNLNKLNLYHCLEILSRIINNNLQHFHLEHSNNNSQECSNNNSSSNNNNNRFFSITKISLQKIKMKYREYWAIIDKYLTHPIAVISLLVTFTINSSQEWTIKWKKQCKLVSLINLLEKITMKSKYSVSLIILVGSNLCRTILIQINSILFKWIHLKIFKIDWNLL